MKRVISIVLVFAFTFSVFGCSRPNRGSNESSSSTVGTKSGDTSAYEGQLPLAGEKVTLSFGTHSGHSAANPQPSNDLPVWKMFEELTNVHIDFQVIPRQSYNDVMAARLAARHDLPDIFIQPAGTSQAKLAEEGVIIAQDALYEKYGYYTKKLFAQPEYKSYLGMMKDTDGKLYGLSNITLPTVQTVCIMLNMEWIKKLNQKTPSTTDEFYNLLKAFRDKDTNGNGKNDEIPLTSVGNTVDVIGDAFGLGILPINAGSIGGLSLDSNGKIVYEKTRPEYKDYLEYLNKLYKEGLLDKNFMTTQFNKVQEYAANDLTGAVAYWSANCTDISAVSPLTTDKTGNTPVFSPILPLKGPKGVQVLYRRLGAGGDEMLISVNCKNKDLAFKWIDFIYASPQAIDTVNWGIEGLTYKVENGKKVKIETPNKLWATSVADIGGRQQPKSYIQFPEYITLSRPDWFLNVMKTFEPYYKDPQLPLPKLTMEQEQARKEVGTDIDVYVKEMTAKFIMGAEPIGNYDAYVKKIQQMGLDKLLSIYQEWYDKSVKPQVK